MPQRYPRYFEYLADYADVLRARLGIRRGDPHFQKSVSIWRQSCSSDPENVTMKCRKTVEEALREMLKGLLGGDREDLIVMIKEAENLGMVSHTIANHLHSIRKAGNKGAHLYPARREAEKALILLDEFLRDRIRALGINPDIDLKADKSLEPIFIIRSYDEFETLRQKADKASLLSSNASLRAETEIQIEYARGEQERYAAISEKLSEAFEMLGELGNPEFDVPGGPAETILDELDRATEAQETLRKSISSSLNEAEDHIDEVLKEHDFIMRLLACNGEATDEQVRVMLFPKNTNSVTNILQISGTAGTGKTLCLVAKLIKELSDNPTSPTGRPSTGLFVCFNKQLSEYVSSMLANFPHMLDRIHVHTVDKLINQLVKYSGNVSDPDYQYLKDFSEDIRYDRGWQIRYESAKGYVFIKEAMNAVASRHPEIAEKTVLPYYFNSQDVEDVAWVDDELCWLESRYEDPNEAAESYLTAERKGRGRKYLPRKDVREIILEIWMQYRNLLAQGKQYTIEQAAKRLVESNDLPGFDAIAVDEVQDLSILQIRSLLKLRTSPELSRVYISGDENQKIYQRDFTWKELDDSLKGHTETLTKNMRNVFPIKRFADRLLDDENVSAADFPTNVFVDHLDDDSVLQLLADLHQNNPNGTIALIGNTSKWRKRIKERLDIPDSSNSSPMYPGVQLLGERQGKGLEFDTVFVDCSRPFSSDEEEEKRIRYVHFTRARNQLHVFYSGKTPELLSRIYPELIS